ncbi:hypothetical protein Tsubulata_047809 [Turnera subulata]|uniref:Zinc finger LSD1-type domain-containing protein n=1 Tax=Turnera subulata TaxID=218843 RepID=A0A9Q0JAS0_9ROSI|nr:hypothetical protein Tsubulata_047809 [Turnera subulata]
MEESVETKAVAQAKSEAIAMEEEQEEDDDEGPPPGWQSIPLEPTTPAPPSNHPLPPNPPPPSVAAEMAQMVCGSCRRLLTYPKGTRHVQCSCCQTVNFVLEEREVGLVNCGSCTVLLMYPHGASSVRCSSCRFVTEIGVCDCHTTSGRYGLKFRVAQTLFTNQLPWSSCILDNAE